jgi:hypothetical protein
MLQAIRSIRWIRAFSYITNAFFSKKRRLPEWKDILENIFGMEKIASYCFDINPSMNGRPVRDGGWIRTQYRELKTKMSVCFNNYNRSGNQEAENVYDSWVNFSTTFNNDVITYSRTILNDDHMDQLGRALPQEIQRDTGVVDHTTTGLKNRQERLQELAVSRKKQRLNTVSPQKEARSSSAPSITSRLAEVIEAGIQEQNKLTAQAQQKEFSLSSMKLLLEFGTAEDKAEALTFLRA